MIGAFASKVQSWSPRSAVDNMDQAGVATAINSMTSPGVWFEDGDAARGRARTCNEFGAQMIRDFSGRFGMFAAIPLRTPTAASRRSSTRSTLLSLRRHRAIDQLRRQAAWRSGIRAGVRGDRIAQQGRGVRPSDHVVLRQPDAGHKPADYRVSDELDADHHQPPVQRRLRPLCAVRGLSSRTAAACCCRWCSGFTAQPRK